MTNLNKRLDLLIKHYGVREGDIDRGILPRSIDVSEKKHIVIDVNGDTINKTMETMVQIMINHGYDVYAIDGADDRWFTEKFIKIIGEPNVTYVKNEVNETLLRIIAGARWVVAGQIKYMTLARLFVKDCLVIGCSTGETGYKSKTQKSVAPDIVVRMVREKSAKESEMDALGEKIVGSIEGLIEKGDTKNAGVLIRELELLNLQPVKTTSLKGIVCLLEGRTERALELFLEGLELDWKNMDLLYNVGMVHEMMGRRQQALDYFERALTVCDNNMEEDILIKLDEFN